MQGPISTLPALARTSKALLEESRRLLYKDVVLEHESQYVPFFSSFTYIPVRGPTTDEHDLPDLNELVLDEEDERDRWIERIRAWDAAGPTLPVRPPSNADYLATLTLLVPPPDEFKALVVANHPHLSRDAYDETLYDSSYLPIPLPNLILHSRERDYEDFAPVCPLLNPTNLRIVSLDPKARTWHTSSAVIPSSWLLLETVVMENCMVVRPEQGDMNPTVAIPYHCCTNLKRIRVEITREDQVSDDEDRFGLLESIWYGVPFLGNGEFENLERFEVAIRGKDRLEGLKEWMVENEEMLMHELMDPERWERWFWLELLEGEVEVKPWNVLRLRLLWRRLLVLRPSTSR
ncbi:hypothetical protein BDY24DRAFT_372495 [Mrakia frigida]|uniref:uncharacterized protein n=1 Tax=Mrakia frigida TaxID=29902 RepID=UPI003FCC06BD